MLKSYVISYAKGVKNGKSYACILHECLLIMVDVIGGVTSRESYVVGVDDFR
jgi:hypothetical protein